MFVLPQTGWSLPELCWFHKLTGFSCAGCGLTRSFLALGKLDVEASIGHHTFGIGFFLLMLGWMGTSIWKKSDPSSTERVSVIRGKILVPILIILILASLLRWGIGIIRHFPVS